MDETRKCPLCAEEIKAEAKVCHFCKAEFDVGQKGYCKSCRKVIETAERDNFCPKCGGELMDRTQVFKLKEKAAPTDTTTAMPVGGPEAATAATVVQTAPGPQAGAVSTEFVKEGRGAYWYQLGGQVIVYLSAFLLWISCVATYYHNSVGTYRGVVAFIILPFILLGLLATLEQRPFGSIVIGRKKVRDAKVIMKQFKASAKELGFVRIYKPRLWPKIIALLIFSCAGMVLWVSKYEGISKQAGASFGPGNWLALVALIMAIGGTLLLIPIKRTAVMIDTSGTVQLLPQPK